MTATVEREFHSGAEMLAHYAAVKRRLHGPPPSRQRVAPVVEIAPPEPATVRLSPPPRPVTIIRPGINFPALEARANEIAATLGITHSTARMMASISVQDIVAAVAEHYRVSTMDILSARRTWNIVRPRMVAMYLAKTLSLRAMPEIGRRMGGKDHTTVLHAVRKIERLRATDPELDAIIRTITARLMGEQHGGGADVGTHQPS